MSELPAYYHLPATQIKELSFRITLRRTKGGSGTSSANNDTISKEIAWQEKIEMPSRSDTRSSECGPRVFTYINADIDPEPKSSTPYKHRLRSKGHGILQRFQNTNGHHDVVEGRFKGFTLRQNDGTDQQPRSDKRKGTLHREEHCQAMAIMAAVSNTHSPLDGSEQVVLCIIKLYTQSGLVTACPAWSEIEPEDGDNSKLFMSDDAIEKVINRGLRLTTYSFCIDGAMYEYTIERIGSTCFAEDTQLIVAEQEHIYRELVEERRERIRKEFESFDCMFEQDTKWDHQAHIEIASVAGFDESSNMLLCTPFGSSIVVRYRILKLSGSKKTKEEEEVVLKGTTASVQSYPTVRGSVEFVTYFLVAFVSIAFVVLLSFGNNEGDASLMILMLIVPLLLIVKAGVIGDSSLYHLNHQFSLLYNDPQEDTQFNIPDDDGGDANASPMFLYKEPPANLVLELRVYFKHNFGVVSLAGCGSVTLPSESGTHDIEVPTWKPIACSSMGETRCRMYDYYLGSCLSEVGPLDSIPSSESEADMTKDTDLSLFSKGGLLTDSSGSIHVRVDVVSNYFSNKSNKNDAQSAREESTLHMVKMRETVDEVLSRVRKNKRGRMARVYNSAEASTATGKENTAIADQSRHNDSAVQITEQTKVQVINNKVSDRAAEALARLRSRKHSVTSTHNGVEEGTFL